MGVLTTLSIGRSALGAASAGIETTSKNITNASTAGYTRRRLMTVTGDNFRRNGNWLGGGVKLVGERRLSDRLLGMRVIEGAGASAAASAAESSLTVAEGYFDETGDSGLRQAWDSVFSSFTALTANPADTGARQQTISSLASFAAAVGRVGGGLQSSLDTANATLSGGMDSVNGMLTEIANLNRAIGKSSDATGPGDLMDRRDQLIRELGEQTGATAQLGADGQATVFIGGQAVVSGSVARTMSTDTDSSGLTEVYVSSDNGRIPVTDQLGGTLGGTVQARTSTVDWLDRLNEFASTTADAINAQHALGYDASGNPGGTVFTYNASDPAASLAIDSALGSDPNLLALASDSTAAAGDSGNLASMLDLKSATLFDGGTHSGGTFLSELTADVGSTVARASSDADVLSTQLTDLDTARASVSGVDTDEEATMLVEYQSAYEAAARVISIADNLLQTLMQMGT